MNQLNRTKIALVLIGLVVFGAGVRLERTELRWIGLGFVTVAWLMRFVRRRNAEESQSRTE